MPRIGPIQLPEFPLLLAPMEDVSDPPFRALCKKHGADLMYTEFISSEGLIRQAAKGLKKLDIFEYERPVGIQLFGGSEDAMEEAARIAEAAGPDLIDINYGCPVHKVVSKGAGACLLQDVDKMVRLTEKVVKAVKLPVTVKTRLGWNDATKNIMEVAERLQDVGIQALSIHGRTRAQLYKGPADWTLIGEVKNNPRIHIPIFGNGDIDSPEKAVEYRDRYGVDGVMIGRSTIGHPFIFNEIKHFIATGTHRGRPRGGRTRAPAQLTGVEGAVGRGGGDAPPLRQLPQGPAQREGGAPAPVHRARPRHPGGDPRRGDRHLRLGRSGVKEPAT